MLNFNRRIQVFACTQPINMTASFDKLCALVRDGFKDDPLSGHLYLFTNRNRHTCKALYWDGTGLVILHKRLEGRQFSRFNSWMGHKLEMTGAEFSLFFEGADFSKRFIESPSEFKMNSLAAS
jgi:transposase